LSIFSRLIPTSFVHANSLDCGRAPPRAADHINTQLGPFQNLDDILREDHLFGPDH
jgi:hypothetical protein